MRNMEILKLQIIFGNVSCSFVAKIHFMEIQLSFTILRKLSENSVLFLQFY